MRSYDADSILWNWARWCASGESVGNMEHVVPFEDEYRPINVDQAVAVERLHKTLPHHEQMVVIAEYPQRNGLFAGLQAKQRREKAQRWIKSVTGVWLREHEYKLYVGLFRDLIWREVA
ncbi:hypothetical protein L1889_18225 [Paenalcaligenes niemegkensis]|uniref:hypothetical protein n=1 Tax=Paenalcaligenes niemegkensis TaxID=2895469 RepID=UPI001EE90A66|nr:hypothetical protein [Paenalcaligenes niemegkensis]MCQ9618377.1 hypothetical protein [Paenalcaligenes niemegkensis]